MATHPVLSSLFRIASITGYQQTYRCLFLAAPKNL